MRKKLVLVLTLVMLMTCVPTSALALDLETIDSMVYANVDIGTASWATIELVAHLDMEAASEVIQEKILQARDTIIFSTSSWVSDEYADENESYPIFSELFPGWDLPKHQATDSYVGISPMNNWTSPYPLTDWIPLTSNTTPPPFGYFTFMPTKKTVFTAWLGESSKSFPSVNIGFAVNGTVQQYDMELIPGLSTREFTVSSGDVTIRVSSLKAEGIGKVIVRTQ